jgi:1-deoxy-D-xylulose-5-phosphate reductoisomerase
MRKRIIILGSTGSIGTSTLDVIRDFPDRFEVAALASRRNVGLLVRQIGEFRPAMVCVTDPEAAREPELLSSIGDATLLTEQEGLEDLVRRCEADVLVVATVGFAGLFPTLAGIERGLRIALANKEVLVVGGQLVMEQARCRGVEMLPIDSEHNAVFQCLAGNHSSSVRRVILTASGGPFRGFSRQQLQKVTREQALDHPTWDMGPKITIDSATLMNKGFEVIEACHLFGVRPDQVDVVIHPQSIVHSMVEYADGSVLAQLGQTNMYLPILNTLAYPERLANKHPSLDLAALGKLEFARANRDLFPCLDYAYEACEKGGTLPAALNAANEVAVAAFLEKRIPFTGIPETIRTVLDQHEIIPQPDLETLREVDRAAREMAETHASNFA